MPGRAYKNPLCGKGGRAVEGTGLENQRGRKLSVSSNLTPSAISRSSEALAERYEAYARRSLGVGGLERSECRRGSKTCSAMQSAVSAD